MKAEFDIYFNDLTKVAQRDLIDRFKTNYEKEKKFSPLVTVYREILESDS